MRNFWNFNFFGRGMSHQPIQKSVALFRGHRQTEAALGVRGAWGRPRTRGARVSVSRLVCYRKHWLCLDYINFRDLAHEFSFFIIHNFFFLLGRHGGDYVTKDIQVLHYEIWPWRIILNGASVSISNLPENTAWQTHKDELRPEARGPLKSGAWGCHPICHPQTPAM
jgi:hypothetical protein